MRIRARLAGFVVGAVAVSAACGSPVSPAPSSAAPASRPVTIAPSRSASGPTASASDVAASAAADPDLFTVIPIQPADGLTFQYDPDTTGRVAADKGLAKDASALAIGLYTVTGQQPVADYAITSIVKLRDPLANEDWFRAYRDSYDASACAQAGGVVRHAEAPIAGRQVFIGSCAGGAFTYHLRLDAQGLVISITGVGPGRLGERVAGLVKP
ncbi:MAG TPA: hypothetical protein VFJ71_13985 [Candidatus Limnocylindrales bacterium]|nr:hypothetical protein [Candidatus Limnocylindrales bacterium]